MLTSRQIIIKLIDNKIITGEEAFTLINDIIQAEMVETYKVLEKKDAEKSHYDWRTTSTPIWVDTSATNTAWTGINSSGTSLSGSSN